MAANDKLQLVTPLARLVEGSATRPSTLDMYGKPREKPEFYIAVAISKTDPAFGPIWQAMYAKALNDFAAHPHVLQRIQAVQQRGLAGMKGTFAFKIGDGDAPNGNGEVRDTHRGHWILKFKTQFPLKLLNWDNTPIADIKRGWMVDVGFTVGGNGKTDHTAGLFVNPTFLRFRDYAAELSDGPSAEQVFGGAAPPPSQQPTLPGAMPAHGGYPQPGAPAVGGYQHQQLAGGMAPGHAPMAPGAGGAQYAQQAPYAAPPSLPGQPPMNGGQGAGNPPGSSGGHYAPTAQPSLNSAAPAHAPLPGATMGIPPGYPFEGNAHASAPAVPGGASAAPGAGYTGVAPGSPTASPSNYQPHPDFVHGGTPR
jgi:hypothetical protein